jgi:hypothetical protein
MNPMLFFSSLLSTIAVVTIAMLYLRHTTRQAVLDLCQSNAGAEFWIRTANVQAYSVALILVLIFGNTKDDLDWVETLRVSSIIALSGVFITATFVAHNIWRTVAQRSGKQS